jgi:Trypsin-like peptidase domain
MGESPTIPWTSRGRPTPISELARSILPVGSFPHRLREGEFKILGTSRDANFDDYLMDIVGTAFQVGRGKLLTCWHVCESLRVRAGFAHVLATTWKGNEWRSSYWSIGAKLSFVDPRTNKGNKEVDVGALVCSTVEDTEFPYDVPIVKWGDSGNVGVGDRVLIAGYPLGRDMFLAPSTNRGLVQPSFYDGIVGAVVPATRHTETRLFQISSIAVGGISGGVVCDPSTGLVLGMVMSGLEDASNNQLLPITYAIPSEVLRPYADMISFTGPDGEIWR